MHYGAGAVADDLPNMSLPKLDTGGCLASARWERQRCPRPTIKAAMAVGLQRDRPRFDEWREQHGTDASVARPIPNYARLSLDSTQLTPLASILVRENAVCFDVESRSINLNCTEDERYATSNRR